MSDLRKAAEQALIVLQCIDYDSFDTVVSGPDKYMCDDAYDALRAALAQPDPVEVREGWEYMRAKGLLQEPVAWMYEWGDQKLVGFLNLDELESARTPLYTAPPQRKPLTLQEVDAIWATKTDIESVVRAVERAHGIGGHNA